MDTKLKKSKTVVSFVSWFIGIILLFINLFSAVIEYDSNPNFIGRIKEVFGEDYQNTDEFRYCMSDYLNTFLAMSIGGSIYEDYGETAYEYDPEYGELPDVSVQTAIEYGMNYDYSSDTAEQMLREWGYEEPPYAADKEDYLEDAEEYHKSIVNDRNKLYTIEKDGKVLYTNEESLGMYGKDFAMPEGYNYLLYFDGKKATVIKDGKEINVYGDGYYRDNTSWYIPGYINFPADEALEGSRICIVAAKVPRITVTKNYDGNGTTYFNNAFYNIQENLSSKKTAYLGWLCSFILMMALLTVSAVLHKSKKEANLVIAGFTAKIWYEIKLIPIIGILYCFIMAIATIIYNGEWYYLEEIWDMGSSFWGIDYLMNKSALICILSLSFGFIWLFINDVRHNEKPWNKSIVSALSKVFRTSMLKLPFGKRMVRQYMWVFFAEFAVGFLMVLLLGIWAYTNFSIEEALLSGGVFVFLLLTVWICQFFYARNNKEIAEDMDALVSQIEIIHSGRLAEIPEVSKDSDLSEAINNLNDIQKGMKTALEEQIKSERMKVELIANVSHDIKTPLTSIISYVELLKQEDDLPDHVRDYISILENKSQRLKAMVQDVFEVSKAASGELSVNMEDLDLGKLIRQTLADMSEQIEESNVIIKTEMPEGAVMIHADGERLYRVFQNLLQNALIYSLEGSRIYVTLQEDGKLVAASIKNTSKDEIPSDVDFTERFVRGDKSRSDGGSGLGLSIAQNFTEACGGTFKVETIADLFVVTVSFKKVENHNNS